MRHLQLSHGTLLTLEPDGTATGRNPVEVGSTPTGVSFTRRQEQVHATIPPGQRRTDRESKARQLVQCVP